MIKFIKDWLKKRKRAEFDKKINELNEYYDKHPEDAVNLLYKVRWERVKDDCPMFAEVEASTMKFLDERGIKY